MNLIRKSIFIVLLSTSFLLYTQEKKKDSVVIKDVYGLRVGIDLSNPARTFFDTQRKSIEILGDYRFSNKLYLAVELGFLDKKTKEDYLDFTTNGQYIKIGANYNLYQNWLDMDNEVFIGLRYGFTNFEQTLHSYSVFSDATLPEVENNIEREFSGLNASWGELVFGMKVETFKNVYLGAAFSFKRMITNKEPENFKNLVVPGFNRVFLNNGGIGFNYTISYRFPIHKKSRVNTEKLLENETEKEIK